ncbi:hypothetical protein Agabi119p4_4058 [Agaricus bisporus var. burnettii]|uniref:protein-tyrosine-phosphatase n=1 Tax=Agaricus bisporus var. burnettii TaxID=192524 RepID=A0A8H7KGZ2_AGABI|nr:hypothetical protein Agabi119p4_4058 [Agaricus bisporus var. burnettii]
MMSDAAASSTSEILKNQLYLGNVAAVKCPDTRKKLGITHVVSVCHEYCPENGTSDTHLHIPVQDTEYEDLLIYLPKTTHFIQNALEEGGRVLVHCVMGVSRSTTVVAAFLMKHKKMDARSALRYIKQRRLQAHPNYGFIKQLDTYSKCQFDPCPTNPVYRSWKKRQEQDVTSFLNQLVDTVSIIPEKLLLSSDFPEDARQAESLLADLGITHVLSISPAELPLSALSATLKSENHHYHINVRNNVKEDLLLAMPGAMQFVEEAMADGLVLVHSLMEVRACTIACACLMKQRNLAPDEAYALIEDSLPLFNPTVKFSRNLELFDACGYQPTRDHSIVQEWLSSNGPEIGSSQSPGFSPESSRRPSGSIIKSTSSISFPKDLRSTTTSREAAISSGSSAPPSSYLSQPMHKRPTSSSRMCNQNHMSPPDTDLGARAKDILSNTGFDLTEFADALKEIEGRPCTSSKKRGNGVQKDVHSPQRKQRAAQSMYC